MLINTRSLHSVVHRYCDELLGRDDRVKGVAADDDGESAEVAAAVSGEARLDLDAEKTALVLDEQIVAMTLAKGLGHAESEAGGFVGEGELGEFSATLVIELVLVHAGRAWHWSIGYADFVKLVLWSWYCEIWVASSYAKLWCEILLQKIVLRKL